MQYFKFTQHKILISTFFTLNIHIFRVKKKLTNVHFNTYTFEESHVLEVKCHIEQ